MHIHASNYPYQPTQPEYGVLYAKKIMKNIGTYSKVSLF